MKTIVISSLIVLFFTSLSYGGGYEIGDKAANFTLKNIDGEKVSLSDYAKEKGVVVIFTCNHCPYAKAYENRIIAIDKTYKEKGYPVVAINPNDPEVVPADSYPEMQKRAKEKGFTFPYLIDETQEVFQTYGAQRTPHVFLLKNIHGEFMVKYIGTIDNNYKDPGAVTETFLSDAIDALLAGKEPDPNFTKAIGCTIKVKKSTE